MTREIVVFKNTRDAIRSERVCIKEGLAVRVVPVPREISANCGIALELTEKSKALILRCLEAAGIEAVVKSIEAGRADR